MAKGARSSGQKQLRTWRREKLVAKWQEEADQRRYAALAAAQTTTPLAPERKEEEEEDADMQQKEARGRARPEPKIMDMDDSAPKASKRSKSKARGGNKSTIKVAGGVHKKNRKPGKLFAAGQAQFGKKARK